MNDNVATRESGGSDLTCRKWRCCICVLLPEFMSSTGHNEYLYTVIIFAISMYKDFERNKIPVQ